jgi:hypothetical protein
MFGKTLAQYVAFQKVFFGATSQGTHLLAHVTIGIVVPTLLLWGVASLVMLIAMRIVRRPVPA